MASITKIFEGKHHDHYRKDITRLRGGGLKIYNQLIEVVSLQFTLRGDEVVSGAEIYTVGGGHDGRHFLNLIGHAGAITNIVGNRLFQSSQITHVYADAGTPISVAVDRAGSSGGPGYDPHCMFTISGQTVDVPCTAKSYRHEHQ